MGLSLEAMYEGTTVTKILSKMAINVIVTPILRSISSGTDVI